MRPAIFLANVLLLLTTTSPSLLVRAQIPSFLTTDFADNQGSRQIEVIYQEKVQEGELLTPNDVSNLPQFKLCDSCGIAPDTKFMIMLLDVDAKGEGKGETPQLLHYLNTDFQSGEGGTDLSSSGRPLASYVPPNPTQGTGKHRYVWLLYVQRRGVNAAGIQDVPSGNDRTFDVLAWIKQNNLELPESGVSFVIDSGAGGGGVTTPAAASTTTPIVGVTTTTAITTALGGGLGTTKSLAATTTTAATTAPGGGLGTTEGLATTTTTAVTTAPDAGLGTTESLAVTTTAVTTAPGDGLGTTTSLTATVVTTITTTTMCTTTTPLTTPFIAAPTKGNFTVGNLTTFTLSPIPGTGTTFFTSVGTGVGTGGAFGTGGTGGVAGTGNVSVPTVPPAPLNSVGDASRIIGSKLTVALLFVASVVFAL